jgi:hypothetical protein
LTIVPARHRLPRKSGSIVTYGSPGHAPSPTSARSSRGPPVARPVRMPHSKLRDLRALPLERPPRRLALLMGVITAVVVLAGAVVLAIEAPPDRTARDPALIQQELNRR